MIQKSQIDRCFVAASTLLLLIAFAAAAVADTIPGGNVSGTWDMAGSPYLVTGEITVPEGLNLTIEPGVEIRLQGYYKFIVRGQLLAVGSVADTIRFEAEDPGTGWHGLRILSTETTGQLRTELRYCRIQDGKAFGTSPDNRGGGIYLDYASATIANCLITANASTFGVATWGGGGIFCDYSNDVVIQDNTISDNYSAGDGGGIYCYWSSPEITGNNIVNNTATSRGAGIALFVNSGAHVDENTISGNIGTGIYVSGSFAWFVNNRITDNTNSGIHCYLCNPYIISNLITGNGGIGGAGIRIEGSSPQITNNTIADNVASSEGGGLYSVRVLSGMLYPSDPYLTNNIVYDNTAPTGSQIYAGIDCTTSIRYSDVQDLHTGGVVGGVSEGLGNIETPPLFDGSGAHPYSLTPNSPCRDSGFNGAPSLPAADVAGNVRIYNGDVDMGAYEFAPAIGVPDALPAAGMALEQNYPNPFNPKTTIFFELAQQQHVRLRIFDLCGRHVVTLWNGNAPAGRSDVTWDGNDELGQPVSSGVYVYRLEAGDLSVAREMLLIR